MDDGNGLIAAFRLAAGVSFVCSGQKGLQRQSNEQNHLITLNRGPTSTWKTMLSENRLLNQRASHDQWLSPNTFRDLRNLGSQGGTYQMDFQSINF